MGAIKKLNRRLAALKTERQSFMNEWRDIDKCISPQTSRFLATDRNRLSRSNPSLFNPQAELALRTLASGMMGGITSPARPWFELRTNDAMLDEAPGVREWLSDVRDSMNDIFLKSNLYTVLPQTYSDLGAYGVHAALLANDDEDVIRLYPFPVGSYVLGVSYRGIVDSCFREYRMSVHELVEQFGLENCSPAVSGYYASGNVDAMVDVVHAVYPNDQYDMGKIQSKFKRFKECYYEAASQEDRFLRESGYDDFPVIAPRWYVQSGDNYGTRCPGMIALPYVKGLNTSEKLKYKGLAKNVDPSYNAPGTMRNQEISLLPNGINFIDGMTGQAGITPVHVPNINLNDLMLDIQKVESQIDSCFFRDLFLMISSMDKSGITAYEIAQRQNEKMMLLGPVLERLNGELLKPLIDRTWAIMAERQMIPAPPPALQGVDLAIEYVSIMAQAQKASTMSAITQTIGAVTSMSAVEPMVKYKIDWLQAVDEIAKATGAPVRMLRSDEDAMAMIQQEQQAQMEAQQAQQAQQLAQTAQTLSQTPLDADSALSPVAQAMASGGGIYGQ